jgi:hypothetical protein
MFKGSSIMGKVQCLECGEVLESKHRHDYVSCNCPNKTSVDGGDDYLRIGGKDLNKIKALNPGDNLEIVIPKTREERALELLQVANDSLDCLMEMISPMDLEEEAFITKVEYLTDDIREFLGIENENRL